MKFLIIGLGNVGEKYELTRHNIGFLILDYFSDKFKKKFLTERYGQYTWLKIKGRKVHLLKPNTFMKKRFLSEKCVLKTVSKKAPRQNQTAVYSHAGRLPERQPRICAVQTINSCLSRS